MRPLEKKLRKKYYHRLKDREYHTMYSGTSLFATLVLAASGVASALDCKCVSFQTSYTFLFYYIWYTNHRHHYNYPAVPLRPMLAIYRSMDLSQPNRIRKTYPSGTSSIRLLS